MVITLRDVGVRLEGARKGLVGIGAGQFLILDLDADYMGIFSL